MLSLAAERSDERVRKRDAGRTEVSLTSEQLGPPRECDAATPVHNRALQQAVVVIDRCSDVTV